MNHEEARATLTKMDGLGTTFVRVYATARPGHEGVTEYRFPGSTFLGYIIASPLDVLGWSDWLDITKIEKW